MFIFFQHIVAPGGVSFQRIREAEATGSSKVGQELPNANKQIKNYTLLLHFWKGIVVCFFPDDNVETGNAVEIIIRALNKLIKLFFFTFLLLAAIPPSLSPLLSVPFEPFKFKFV